MRGHSNQNMIRKQMQRDEATKELQIMVGVHGQWTSEKHHGPVARKGTFKFPLVGDSVFKGEMLNGQRFGHGRQVNSS